MGSHFYGINRGVTHHSQRHDCSMVMVGKLTKSAHFTPIKSTFNASAIAQLFHKKIIRPHEVPRKFISDRDSQFTCRFWYSLQVAMGMQLNFTTIYHLGTYRQTKRVNQVMEDKVKNGCHGPPKTMGDISSYFIFPQNTQCPGYCCRRITKAMSIPLLSTSIP